MAEEQRFQESPKAEPGTSQPPVAFPEDPEKQDNSSSEASDAKEAPVREMGGAKWALVVISILSSILVYALDNTIVAVLIPPIVNDFKDVGDLGWLTVGFMIGGVASILPLGKLYNILDAKWLYLGSMIVFMAASALCGGAPTMNAMIVGRVFAGAGGIGLYIGVMTLLSVNTTEKERPAYLSLVGLVWGAGTVLGPVIGGAFEQVTWRWAFYINLIIGAVFSPVYLFMLPSFHPTSHVSLKERFGKLDGVGIVISIAAFITIIMPINFGGTLYSWSSGSIIALFVVSGVLWIAFGIQQGLALFTTKETRLFPVEFVRNKEAVLLFVLAAACNSAVFVPIYYIPIYFQFTRGDDALQSAVRLLPLIFLLCFTILSNGYLMSKMGYYMPWYAVGSAFALVATVCLSRINASTSTSYIYGFEALLGLGGGAFVQAGYAVIQSVVDADHVANAVSFMMIAQIGGIALSLAIASSVFINGATVDLKHLLPNVPVKELQASISGTSSGLLAKLPESTRQNALNIIINNMGKTFIPAYAAAALAFVGAMFLRRKRTFIAVGAAA
ncbi:MFS drug efflux transporter-like protein [Xylona heveae TC161]|uniref:MFS drug efflux transporter-like protein n=1 Tax=Xylona heveae (strain CBS 132557 / TC161) TaxID=1328760 RepID=A0A165AAK3_XYLHT|nr:MFS drug efflux transporter-like protein [Xylona heveae TC161]KZF20176.1 MFS drug efflux transporter-like protein [Xylona heveae TC161]